jgi:hypothetical protein
MDEKSDSELVIRLRKCILDKKAKLEKTIENIEDKDVSWELSMEKNKEMIFDQIDVFVSSTIPRVLESCESDELNDFDNYEDKITISSGFFPLVIPEMTEGDWNTGDYSFEHDFIHGFTDDLFRIILKSERYKDKEEELSRAQIKLKLTYEIYRDLSCVRFHAVHKW